jgi:two-component system, chemotaxis family, protein-glutamate methylesterase/glutaminase
MDIYQLGPQLRDKVLAVARADRAPTPLPEVKAAPEAAPAPPPATPRRGAGDYEIVAIGASTGGPRALTEILPRLPADLATGIVVAQHMPSGFTATLAERLDERCAVRVREARDREAVEPGVVLIAPGGKQTQVEREGGRLMVRISSGSPTLLHHPSVDILFDSIAHTSGARAVGVVLTGMGQDGAVGLQRLRDAGARTLVESSETAVIFGMPRAAQPAAERVLPLPRIAGAIVELCGTTADAVGDAARRS